MATVTTEPDVEDIDATDTPEPALAALSMEEIADMLDLQNRVELDDGVLFGQAHIDPERAGLLLDINPRNRRISRELVSAYARMMRNDQWLLNGATIAVGLDNVLQDGQHRIEAVVESGTTQSFLVMLGLPPESQDVTDTGRRRSAADQMGIHGVPNAANAAATVRLLLAWAANTVLHASYSIGNIEATAFSDRHGDDLNESVAVGLSARNNGLPMSVAVIAAMHFRLKGMEGVTREDIDQFFARVCQGEDIQKGDPEFALRRMMLRRRATNQRTPRGEALFYLIRAWNARRKGEQLDKLQLPRLGLTPNNFPEPIAEPGQPETVKESEQESGAA